MAFTLVDDPKTSLLAWTTTPWTLPSNLALCVHPKLNYIKIYDEQRDQNFIIYEGLLITLYKDPKKPKFKKIGQFQGADMKGWRYVPLFDYFTEQVSPTLFIYPQFPLTMISLRIVLSVSSSMSTLPARMVLALSTKHRRLATTPSYRCRERHNSSGRHATLPH